jgi:hypothetical protein
MQDLDDIAAQFALVHFVSFSHFYLRVIENMDYTGPVTENGALFQSF